MPATDAGGLSVRTGVPGDQRGKLVWADVRWEGAAPVGAAATGDAYEAAIRDGEKGLRPGMGVAAVWVPPITFRDALASASNGRAAAGGQPGGWAGALLAVSVGACACAAPR